jgi:thiamine biosynthesis lipoprotein
MSNALHHLTFACMGCDMSLTTRDGAATRAARRLLDRFDEALSRFDPRSELSRLNRDPGAVVPASALLRSAVRASLWAARRSGGLVDPTLLRELERHGYDASLEHLLAAELSDALAAAPARRFAAPSAAARWREIHVDDARGTITRPPGVALDTGGTTKGLAADTVAHVLDDQDTFVVDCAGDLRIRALAPLDVTVEHPLTGETAHTLRIADGAVATSGIGRRIWSRPDGTGFAHHLLDPATGAPAWTGLVSATALASTALEAETLAKAALLRGPRGARELLCVRGGVLVHDDGDVEPVGRRALSPLRVRATDLLGKRAPA